ncbi:hypothetical protein SARC_12308, partial [Sphaeroforma arctica JP610]
PLLGHNFPKAQNACRVIGSSENLFFYENTPIPLTKLGRLALVARVPNDVTYEVHWLAIEGKSPAVQQEKAPAVFSIETVNPSHAPRVDLEPEQLAYLEDIKKSLLDGDQQRVRTALDCLSSDRIIEPLVPFFIDFVMDLFEEHCKNLKSLTAAVRLLLGLMKNKHVAVQPYIATLLPRVMSCVLKRSLPPGGKRAHNSSVPLQAHVYAPPAEDGVVVNDWQLRGLTALLIPLMCDRWEDTKTSLKSRVTKLYVKGLLETDKTFGSNFGAILGLAALGNESIAAHLLPNLKTYSQLLEATLSRGAKDTVKTREAEMIRKLLHSVLGTFFNTWSTSKTSTVTSVSLSRSQADALGTFAAILLPFINSLNIEALSFADMDRRTSKKRKKEKHFKK